MNFLLFYNTYVNGNMRKYYRVYKRAHFDFQKRALFFMIETPIL